MTDAEYQMRYGWLDEDAHNGVKSKERVRKFAEVISGKKYLPIYAMIKRGRFGVASIQ